jgi:hypothetical protein
MFGWRGAEDVWRSGSGGTRVDSLRFGSPGRGGWGDPISLVDAAGWSNTAPRRVIARLRKPWRSSGKSRSPFGVAPNLWRPKRPPHPRQKKLGAVWQVRRPSKPLFSYFSVVYRHPPAITLLRPCEETRSIGWFGLSVWRVWQHNKAWLSAVSVRLTASSHHQSV